MGKDELKYRAYKFSLEIVKFVASLSKDRITQIIAMQLLKCGTSVGANVVEAQSGTSRKDFINFYSIALKSANETKFWLCLLRDSKISKSNRCLHLLEETVEIAKIIGQSILTMKGK